MDDTKTIVITDDNKAIPKTVTMYPDQWAVVDEVDEINDFRNLSSALRHIVNEYRRMKARPPYSVADPA